MAYKLKDDEALAEGVRRIARAELVEAIEIAKGTREVDNTPVHETRKHLKKARAALRLVRKEIGRSLFRQQDHRLRDIGHLVSEVRDAEVRLQTVRELQSIQPRRGRVSYRQLEQMLMIELENFMAAFAEWQAQALPLLEQAKAAVDSWPVDHFDTAQLRRAVQASYKRARSCLAEARKNLTSQAFHDFRTEAKVLTYQLRILRPINPVVLKNLCEEVEAIGDLLGRAHDLFFLGDRLRGDRGHAPWQREGHKLLAVLEVSQSDLQRAAADLAERFFAERPRGFGERVATWLNNWTASRSSSVAEALVT
ncbi:MAG: CHAD domain-containing protein [Chthoniobacterales bacterium]